MRPNQGVDFVITGLQPWDIEIGSNCKNLAIEFSKTHRVLYVNSPFDRFTVWRDRQGKRIKKYEAMKSGKLDNLVEVLPNLWVLYPLRKIESISSLPFFGLFNWLNKRNNQLFADEIQIALKRLSISNFIHFCDSDMFRSFYLKEILKPQLYIYYTRDNLLAVDYWKRHGLRIEPLHMKKADLVAANSPYLAQIASKYNTNSHFVGQGCDLSAFNYNLSYTIPDDIGSIPHPRIGYVGALNSFRLDIEIVEKIAKQREDWNLVLVGPEDSVFKESSLHQLKNVFFLGAKQENELPAYIQAFDVAINPQKVNDVTMGNYPRKIDEYLAMGKPVVATHTITMEFFSTHVSLAFEKDDWMSLIESQLKQNSPQEVRLRHRFASDHSWHLNAKAILNLAYEEIKNKPSD